MNQIDQTRQKGLYPICLEPICQYRLWGGHRLGSLNDAFFSDSLVGEVWLLSDREDFANRIKNGKFKGVTFGEIFNTNQEELMGKFKNRYKRFPLLLKFLDAQEMISVQVHPTCSNIEFLKKGERSKTEAWVTLESGAESCIYAGVKAGTTKDDLRRALNEQRLIDYLCKFQGKPGDAFFLPAGTIHSLADTVVFEVQENSDTTFRLYDWERVDAKTGLPRELQIEEALACANLKQTEAGLRVPVIEAFSPVLRERIFDCKNFRLWRHSGKSSFVVGEEGEPRILVNIEGSGYIMHEGQSYVIKKGEVIVLPAVMGKSVFETSGKTIILEIGLPKIAGNNDICSGDKLNSP